jgi:hypothetical protein
MKGISTIARASFILAVAAVLCVAMVAVASASVTETGNQWVPAGPSQGDVTQFKTGADSGVGQLVPAPAVPARPSGSSSATVVVIVLAAIAACALLVFVLMRRRAHPQAATVSSLPGQAGAQHHTKAA